MVDYAKANPGKLSVGQPGVGSMGHTCLTASADDAPWVANA
jgi:tripartite-type tricarboxylate transporter receptor subunit TctC